jgi:hypothetical protein
MSAKPDFLNLDDLDDNPPAGAQRVLGDGTTRRVA